MTGTGRTVYKSLQDGRAVWLDGERVDKIAGHPAFQGTLNTLKRLFDTLDDPKIQEHVGFRSPKTGAYVHYAYLLPSSAEDLKRRTRAFEIWGRMTHGAMSRLSEYARSLVTGCTRPGKGIRRLIRGLRRKSKNIMKKPGIITGLSRPSCWTRR